MSRLIYALPLALLTCAEFARSAEDLPEEITVEAPVSLLRLKTQLNRAAVDMFNVFNALNDDDRFDIHCRYVTRWQSKIREQVCSAKFFDDVKEQEAEQLMKDIGIPGASVTGPGVATLQRDNAILEEKLRRIAAENAEFADAVKSFTRLSEAYDARRKFGNEDED